MRKLFGTDGIRGVANKYPLTINICIKLARSLQKKCKNHLVIIGKDTRISGDIFEHALAAEFASLGIKVELIGVCPTPAISILTQNLSADFGIMISASHNPFADNGIKIFNHKGLKLTDYEEEEIENDIESIKIIEEDNIKYNEEIIGDKVCRINSDSNAIEKYIQKIQNSFSFDKSITQKIKIVIDSANGSFSKIAPKIFRDFGFTVISTYDSPNGININDNCGVTHPNILSALVTENQADIGIAFDGDGDRLLLCDSNGYLFDGDSILAILVEFSDLRNTEIVSTIMSNFGLEEYLNEKNIKLIRTNVGDRYISEYMQKSSEAIFGGENSGHIIIKEHAPTGDGLFAGLKIIEYIINSKKKLSEFENIFSHYPVVNHNIRVIDKNIIKKTEIANLIKQYENQLLNRGKIIIRASGTEPLIRISAEGKNENELKTIVKNIAETIKRLEKKQEEIK